MNWDDLKVLLALSREGSTRKAASTMGVSNTTVMRRLESLEEHIGGKLFNRTPDGYKPTALADQLLPTAITVEQTLVEAERQVSGKDSELSGRVKLSLPGVPVTHISESVAEFALKYPRIELDIAISDEPVDLARREADIAVRGLPKDKRPPKDIVGIKIGRISLGYYVHKELLSEAARGQRQLTCIRASHTVLNLGDLPAPETLGLESRHLIDGLTPRMVAVTHKLGVAALPCFLARQHPDLILLPGVPSAHWGHTWLLHHKDLRQSARIRALFQHLAELGEKWPSVWDTSVEEQIKAA
ncbi:LysR family transcriptional regulator [Luminiphilus sp.]|nr:LysR family transcriptional regulator [Luminiphilus sp.]